jgi:hypothetical protein
LKDQVAKLTAALDAEQQENRALNALINVLKSIDFVLKHIFRLIKFRSNQEEHCQTGRARRVIPD